jgi:ABC-type bacteriocin/lantibiotic exporter with double-glycine peptidase domain
MKHLSIVLAALFLGSFPAPQQEHGVWLDVPYVKQTEDACGSAALSMLLQYWSAHGAPVDPARFDAVAIQGQLYSPQAHGIYASAMERYLRESGFRTFSFTGTWDDLGEQLRKGRPLIVGLHPGGEKSPWHYVVITGMDRREEAVLVNDPARGKLVRIERQAFRKQWSAAHDWMLLAVPQQAN